ncbi:unnamed protein product [marine sediment metagenome]|uniref:Uncharacterized protein n=1 Tax=marine sediment metagenome TaxID=412755 RepID=X1UC08_9ZZZZ
MCGALNAKQIYDIKHGEDYDTCPHGREMNELFKIPSKGIGEEGLCANDNTQKKSKHMNKGQGRAK